MYPFNVRVYGLLINDQNQILISDEQEYGMQFSKFPGGGLEYGEGSDRRIENGNLLKNAMSKLKCSVIFIRLIFSLNRLLMIRRSSAFITW